MLYLWRLFFTQVSSDLSLLSLGPYYRVHHGENKITPKQQNDIMQILVKFGSTEGIKFDHYETDWDFG